MNSLPRGFESNRAGDGLNPLAFGGIDLVNLMKDKTNDEAYYFLLLTIYFYLKHNNYHSTAEILFAESNLGRIFTFPQEILEGGGISEQEQILKKKFVHYFFSNTFFQQTNGISVDFLSDFWNQFWDIFVDKIRQNNPPNATIDQYLSANKTTLMCKYIT
jgi:hypothetical protein